MSFDFHNLYQQGVIARILSPQVINSKSLVTYLALYIPAGGSTYSPPSPNRMLAHGTPKPTLRTTRRGNLCAENSNLYNHYAYFLLKL